MKESRVLRQLGLGARSEARLATNRRGRIFDTRRFCCRPVQNWLNGPLCGRPPRQPPAASPSPARVPRPRTLAPPPGLPPKEHAVASEQQQQKMGGALPRAPIHSLRAAGLTSSLSALAPASARATSARRRAVSAACAASAAAAARAASCAASAAASSRISASDNSRFRRTAVATAPSRAPQSSWNEW